MIEIDLRQSISPRHHEVLRALAQMGRSIDISTWCLVGGMMVVTSLAHQGTEAKRASNTKDIDVVVDVCAKTDVLRKFVHELQMYGFRQIEDFAYSDTARCSFVGITGTSQLDILCPNDADQDQLICAPEVESIAVPGGRRALELARPVRITYDDLSPDVEIRTPLIEGALIVKCAAALDPRTSGQSRHIQDVGELMLAISSPDAVRGQLESEDIDLLRRLQSRIESARDVMWAGCTAGEVQQAQSVFKLLTS